MTKEEKIRESFKRMQLIFPEQLKDRTISEITKSTSLTGREFMLIILDNGNICG